MKQLSAETVKKLIDHLEASSIDVWLDGGWGVDALVGAQTRPHADLDIIVSQDDIPRLRAILEPAADPEDPGDPPGSVSLASPALSRVFNPRDA